MTDHTITLVALATAIATGPLAWALAWTACTRANAAQRRVIAMERARERNVEASDGLTYEELVPVVRWVQRQQAEARLMAAIDAEPKAQPRDAHGRFVKA